MTTTETSKQIRVSLPDKEPFTITISPLDILSDLMISHMGTLCYTIGAIPYVVLDGGQIPVSLHEINKNPINTEPINVCQIHGMNVYDTISGMGVYWT